MAQCQEHSCMGGDFNGDQEKPVQEDFDSTEMQPAIHTGLVCFCWGRGDPHLGI